jgi:transcriptional regulator with XRE-family HTH domain
MGHAPREKTEHLAKKLLDIRKILGLSQNEIIRHLNLTDKLTREDVSKFERGIREPSLRTLLKYARAINVSTDVLIDDELELSDFINTKP